MTLVTIKSCSENLDDVRLVIRGDYPTLMHIRRREDALELVRLLMIARFEEHSGALTVALDGVEYTLSAAAWRELYAVTDPWFAEFLADMDLVPAQSNPTSADIVPIFGE